MDQEERNSYAERIRSAVETVLADSDISPALVAITVEELEGGRAFNLSVRIAQGPGFTWASRIEKLHFERALQASLSQLKAWL
jgi:hypothetical protein